MPAPMIADCLNYNLRFARSVEDIGILVTSNGMAVSTSSARQRPQLRTRL